MVLNEEKLEGFIEGGVFTKEALDFIFESSTPAGLMSYMNKVNKYKSHFPNDTYEYFYPELYMEAHKYIGDEIESYGSIVYILIKATSRLIGREFKTNRGVFYKNNVFPSDFTIGEDKDTEFFYGMSYKPKQFEFELDSILRLDKFESKIIKMRLHGYSGRETAEKLGVTQTTVEKIFRRIRNRVHRDTEIYNLAYN